MVGIDKFQTEVSLPLYPEKMGYGSPFLMVGSCFATNIGERLVRLKLPVMVNPFGVLYNPLSIAHNLKMLVDAKQLNADDLFLQNGIWNSYTHHSSFSDANKQACLDRINQSLLSGAVVIREASHLVVTLGTSWAYRLLETGGVVANCHRTPASHFDRIFVPAVESASCLADAFESIRAINPSISIILTVSPIRHVKDGLVENQRSKSSLIVACHELCSQQERVSYFPSYEILMDELRDYRFYADDMVHPSNLAIDIIFRKFVGCILDQASQRAMAEVEQVVRAAEHRPFNPFTKEHVAFKLKMAQKARMLHQKYSFLDLTDEIDYFEAQ